MRIVQHTEHELRDGLRSALDGTITPKLREVESELRLAGFLIEPTTVTPAGRRFLGAPGADDG
jgi:hypothetical protein